MKPTWLTRLRPASFRGVPFHVGEADGEFGRRKVIHEFPGRDKPFTEDMGRKAQKFPITGYVIGDNYLRQRDILIAAAEKEGAGRLIHPYYGIKTVDCMSLTVSESLDDGGLARITFEFVESGSPLFPLNVVDKLLALANKIDAMVNQAALEFASVFSVLQAPAFIVESAVNAIEDLAKIIAGIGGIGFSDIPKSVENLLASSRDLVLSPLSLSSAVVDALNLKVEGLADKSVAADSVIDVAAGMKARPLPEATTANRRREQENLKALNTLVATQAVCVASRASIQAIQNQEDALVNGFDEPELVVNVVNADGSIEGRGDASEVQVLDAVAAPRAKVISSADAVRIRDKILSEVDVLLDEATDDHTFSVLADLRAQLVDAIPGGVSIPEAQSVTLLADTPALVLAYDRYEDLGRETDIVDRNNVSHPGQIAAGGELELLVS